MKSAKMYMLIALLADFILGVMVKGGDERAELVRITTNNH